MASTTCSCPRRTWSSAILSLALAGCPAPNVVLEVERAGDEQVYLFVCPDEACAVPLESFEVFPEGLSSRKVGIAFDRDEPKQVLLRWSMAGRFCATQTLGYRGETMTVPVAISCAGVTVGQCVGGDCPPISECECHDCAACP